MHTQLEPPNILPNNLELFVYTTCVEKFITIGKGFAASKNRTQKKNFFICSPPGDLQKWALQVVSP
jgi:hypothetical protein